MATTHACVTLERRGSDFGPGEYVNAYTGSGCCCCCCCVHWVGALAGGIVGGRLGWKSGEQPPTNLSVGPHVGLTAYSKDVVKNGVVAGLFASVVATIATFLLAAQNIEFPMFALALAPSLFFVPVVGTTVFGVFYRRARLRSRYGHEHARLAGVKALPDPGYREAPMVLRAHVSALDNVAMFCTSCWEPLPSGEILLACPSCAAPVPSPAIPEHSSALRLAWHVSGKMVLWSTLLSAGGYAIMLILLLLFK
jgi:hypothetical protein